MDSECQDAGKEACTQPHRAEPGTSRSLWWLLVLPGATEAKPSGCRPRSRPQNARLRTSQHPRETRALSPGPALGLHQEPAFYKHPAVTLIKGSTEI